MKRMERKSGMVGGMEVCREEKKCSVSALASWKNPRRPQRICSDVVNMLQTGPVPPTRHARDCIVGNTEQYRVA